MVCYRSATLKSGGCYLYNNLRGCDGQRTYFNGCSCVSVNGQMVARTAQFGIVEVELAAAVIDLEDIRSYRNQLRSRTLRGAAAPRYPRVDIAMSLSVREEDCLTATAPLAGGWSYHTPQEEISLGPACWLWDYLRRSGQGGYFLPLSGGVDSASSAVLVHSMCRLVVDAVQQAGLAIKNSPKKNHLKKPTKNVFFGFFFNFKFFLKIL